MNIPYTLTNDSVTVVIDGKVTTVAAGAVNFNAIRDAIFGGNFAEIPSLLTQKAALGAYLQGSMFFESAGRLTYGESLDPLPEQFERRIRATAEKGESPKGLLNFYARLQNNPSSRSVSQLWPFLDHEGIPIEESGHFLAYKAVREDLLDCHSGTIDNTPGNVIRIPRNKISDDNHLPCHFGLHVGAIQYAHSFGDRILIVRVDPADVVCIPFDHSFQKMRVCSYEVVGFHTGDKEEGLSRPMPSTTYEVDTDEDEDEDLDDSWNEDESEGDEDNTGFTAFSKGVYSPAEDDYGSPMRTSHGEGTTVTEDAQAKFRRMNRVVPKPAKTFKNWDVLDAKTLLGQSIADLRTYASKKLKIVGASKLAGGKTALVKRILKVRK